MSKKNALICAYIFIFFISTELMLRLAGWKEPLRLYEEILDPDICWVHTAGFNGAAMFTYVKISSQRLRDKEYSWDKPKDTFRIIALGECTTFGAGVAPEESFVKRLEAKLNERKPFGNFKHYEVINAGLSQYTDLQKVYFLEKYGLKFNPDLIFFSHDLGPKPWVETRFALRWVRLITQCIPRQIYSMRYLICNIEHIINQKWNSIANRHVENLIRSRYVGSKLIHLNTDKALAKLACISQEKHIPVIVIFHPWMQALYENNYPYKWIHEFYGEKCRKNNLFLLDLYKAYFKNKQANLFWLARTNRRPNDLAHKITASVIYRTLIASKKLAF